LFKKSVPANSSHKKISPIQNPSKDVKVTNFIILKERNLERKKKFRSKINFAVCQQASSTKLILKAPNLTNFKAKH